MDASHVESDLVNVLYTEEQIQAIPAWSIASSRCTPVIVI